MDIEFHGAAGEVTGSCARVSWSGGSFLVDCGMFQGGRTATLKNLHALNFDLSSIDFVLLTHAHLDHSGLLPRLVALGWKGPVHATKATVDLLQVMLLDSAHIQEKEAEWVNRRARARNPRSLSNAAPLYTVLQAQESLLRLCPHGYDATFAPKEGVMVRFREAGHILGSAIIEIDLEAGGSRRRMVFSGDLGMRMRPVLRDPVPMRRADYLVVESTYGDRAHRSIEQTEDELVSILRETLEHRGGNVIIPAFAVGRTQEVIYLLAELVRSRRIERLEVVVDSPMAAAVTALTLQHDDLWDDETLRLRDWAMANPGRFQLRFVADVEESIALNSRKHGLVIISASGMCEAGRIKHHLVHSLPRPECSVIICGFQAGGTLGRRLVEGARFVTLFGDRVPVRASVHTIGGLSAHADQPALLDWMSAFEHAPRKCYVVHGERGASCALADAVRQRLGWANVQVAEAGVVERLA